MEVNDHLVLLGGKSSAGKSMSLMNLRNPEGVMYLNCESGKKLPFPAKFKQYTVTDPLQVLEAFDRAETMDVHTIVVDSLTYLMDLYESVYVLNAQNTMKAWSEFAQFFKRLMQQYVARSTKRVVFTAHTLDTLNEAEMTMDTKVPVKGALKNQGIESYFSVVIGAKKVDTADLSDYSNDLLSINDEERALELKYVFQTRLTRDTRNERLRGPLGLFSVEETFIDNDMQKVFDRLDEYYA